MTVVHVCTYVSVHFWLVDGGQVLVDWDTDVFLFRMSFSSLAIYGWNMSNFHKWRDIYLFQRKFFLFLYNGCTYHKLSGVSILKVLLEDWLFLEIHLISSYILKINKKKREEEERNELVNCNWRITATGCSLVCVSLSL